MVNEGEVMIVGYDHVQVAIPSGAEPVAREYYGGLLGMIELPKPATLAARGGCWFTAGAAVPHLGVEADFRAARKAHPALIVEDLDVVERTVRLADDAVCSSQGCVHKDALQSALAHQAHGRVALDVVPDCAHRLLEGPSLAALPLEVVASKIVPERLPRDGLEQMPGTN